MPMKYMSVKTAAEKWNVSERSVRNYCAEGKIPDVILEGKTWKIHKVCEASLFSFDYVVISSYKFYRQLRNELLMSGINEKQIVYRDWVKLCYL